MGEAVGKGLEAALGFILHSISTEQNAGKRRESVTRMLGKEVEISPARGWPSGSDRLEATGCRARPGDSEPGLLLPVARDAGGRSEGARQRQCIILHA